MLSKYFEIKINNKKFEDDLKWSLGELKDKKVLLYGAGESFLHLNKKYHFNELNVVAIADRKFEEETVFEGFKAISPEEISKQDYDVILITNEKAYPIITYFKHELNICDKEIKTVFNKEFSDEDETVNYAEKFNFKKNLEKLTKKLKGKSIIVYGAGSFFETINYYYDLSGLNIISLSDKKFSSHEEEERFLGYKVCSPSEIEELKPDYVLVATKFYIDVVDELFFNVLKNTKIKILPLVKKSFFTLLKEFRG